MTANLNGHDNELLINSCANFGLDGFIGTVARTHNSSYPQAVYHASWTRK